MKTHMGFMEKSMKKVLGTCGCKRKGKDNFQMGLSGPGAGARLVPRAFSRTRTFPTAFAENSNVTGRCCNTGDLELEVSCFITGQ